ncbi:MAG: ComEC/Rec2 family competence protein [Patescibacteria group bacterium]|jgi:ComEC/Rec2-related protein
MPLSRAQLLFFSCLSFIAGIFFGNFFIFSAFWLFCLGLTVLFSVFVLGFGIRNKKPVNEANGQLLVFLLFLFFLIFGWWRCVSALPKYNQPERLSGYASSTVEFIGRIVRVDKTVDSQKLTVKAGYLIRATPDFSPALEVRNRPVVDRVAVKTDLYPEWQLAEKVAVSCRLIRPGMIDDFDYARYLRKDGVFVACVLAEVKSLAPPSGLSVLGHIGHLKSWLTRGINSSLSEPQASIIRGIILGDSRGIPEFYGVIFANLGLTHIIAVSGSHLVVVFAIILNLLIAFGVRRQKTFWPSVFIIAGYVILVGAPASAVRSAIMALAALYATALGRLTGIKNILACTAAIMLLFNPFTLLDDVGFQLSFASVLGLGYLLPIIKRYFKDWPEFWQIKEIVLTTGSAQLSTLPLILYYFGRLSLLSLPANLLILPIIPPLMILSLINAIAGAIFPALGKMIGWLTWLAVQYWLTVSRLIDSLPLSSVELAGFGLPALIIFYFLLFCFIWRQNNKL